MFTRNQIVFRRSS